MTDNNDSREPERAPDDPLVEALLVIAGELRAIRQELASQGDEGDGDNEDNVDEYECRSCDVTLAGDAAARQHAERMHGAPADDWRTLFNQ